MAEENVEIVRRVYEAEARRDSAAVLALYDPSLEWDHTHSPVRDVMGGPQGYRGHRGLRAWSREWYEAWDNVEADALESPVEIHPQHVEALEEEEETEGHHDRAARELDHEVVVAQPPERAHRAGEDRSRENERDREPERIEPEQHRCLKQGVCRPSEHEDRREDRADAGRRADGERAAEQYA